MTSEFDRFARTYNKNLQDAMPAGLEDGEYFASYKTEYVANEMAGREVSRILDFGCGAGRSLQHLATAFPRSELHGFDPSVESIRIARKQYPLAKFSTDWSDVATFQYGLILAANVFHHIEREQIPQWLSRCREVLTDNGDLFLFEHNPLNPITRRVFERCIFDQDAQMIAREDLEKWSRDAGLAIVVAKYTLFFPKPLRLLRPLERWLRWLPFGAQYCLRLKKKA